MAKEVKKSSNKRVRTQESRGERTCKKSCDERARKESGS